MKRQFIYDRVYIIGVDGAGNFFTKADTPEIDSIFSDYACNHNTLTAYPTISAQCWGSLLHGVSPQAHRFTNGLVDFPVPEDHPYPSIFKALRKALPNAELASVVNWNAINKGIIEQGLDIIAETGNDDEVAEKVIDIINSHDPKLLFVQFDSVDGAGHRYGYGAPDYLKTITHVDSLIGKIYKAAEAKGKTENALIIVTADHGGSPDGHHGSDSKAEIIVSYYVRGKSVNKGNFGDTELRDTASIALFALGVEQPTNWSSKVPDGLFTDCESTARASEVASDGSKRYSNRKNKPEPMAEDMKISAFIDYSSLKCRFPFNGTHNDETGKSKSIINGKLYYTEGFYGEAAVFDDSSLECGEISSGTNYYTFCAWLKINKYSQHIKRNIYFSKDNSGNNSLAFYIEDEQMVHEITFNGKVIRYSRPLPGNYDGNWFHFICSYDRIDNELCFYYDFTLECDWYSDVKIPREIEFNGNSVTIGGNSAVTVDDLLFFDHKLSDIEIDNLQKYYEQ